MQIFTVERLPSQSFRYFADLIVTRFLLWLRL